MNVRSVASRLQISVFGHAPLKGIDIPIEAVPLAIDELPAVLIAAACAQGVTVLAWCRGVAGKRK